ncbi:hypothetical protein QR680_011869 [Steinernema hermaphroditum]|uniref:F-box domain-containing protein n=1 Tax=Steinernema hermaphroditum TaxID=289476 RepID=A0AA39I007_9BILA|nr:hypothetical protein QR680_011869 [Steinernema hermaphroditum]
MSTIEFSVAFQTMEFIPLEFIDSVISLLSQYELCQHLAGNWGKPRKLIRKSLFIYASPSQKSMFLGSADPKDVDSRHITISNDLAMNLPSKLDENEFISAVTQPPSMRRGQSLELKELRKSDKEAASCSPLIDAVNGYFSRIEIQGVDGYERELEDFFLRIRRLQMPNILHISHSDVSQNTVDLIMESCSVFKSSELHLYPNKAAVTTEQLKAFFSKWKALPYKVSLKVRYIQDRSIESMMDLCGFGLKTKGTHSHEHIYVNETFNVKIWKIYDGLQIVCESS